MTRAPGPADFNRVVGLESRLMEAGRAIFTVTLRPEHLNPYGVVHGGVVYSLVDTAMGGALVSRLDPGERCATLEIKINYLAPAVNGTLACEATLVERTRRIGVLEARVRDSADRVIAVATGSFYIITEPAPR